MPLRKSASLLLVAGLLPHLWAQQPIGRTSATEVQVAGAVDISHGETLLGNGSEITAGNQAVNITLTRGGALRLCSTSSVHLAKDRSVDDPASSALMMALDRGAVEANYGVGKFSDVLMTPDLRILISGPGHADLSIRVNTKGDTCVDNHGVDAPYVIVSSQLEGGAYRVMPGQRVSFQHGSLGEVVDHEPEPCGCPPVPSTLIASSAAAGTPAASHPPVGGPSSTPADTAFPMAESEGLAPPPVPHNVPAVPSGQTQAQVSAGLTYNGEAPAAAPPAEAASVPSPAPPADATAVPPPAPPPSAPVVSSLPGPVSAAPLVAAPPAQALPAATTSTMSADTPAQPVAPQPAPAGGNVFRRLGHFFSRIFGK